MVFGALIEYACVGYTAKRIQLRKNRFLAVQKLAEEKKEEALKQMSNMKVTHCIPTIYRIHMNLFVYKKNLQGEGIMSYSLCVIFEYFCFHSSNEP